MKTERDAEHIQYQYIRMNQYFLPYDPWPVVGNLLLKSNCITLRPLLLKETSYI